MHSKLGLAIVNNFVESTVAYLADCGWDYTVSSPYINFHQNRAIIGLRTRLRSLFQPKHAKLKALIGYFWG